MRILPAIVTVTTQIAFWILDWQPSIHTISQHYVNIIHVSQKELKIEMDTWNANKIDTKALASFWYMHAHLCPQRHYLMSRLQWFSARSTHLTLEEWGGRMGGLAQISVQWSHRVPPREVQGSTELLSTCSLFCFMLEKSRMKSAQLFSVRAFVMNSIC